MNPAAARPRAAGPPREPLSPRVERYIRAHLGDQALSARQIAAAHFISLRQLYYAWPGRDRSLAEWIISERLAAAATELAARPGPVAIAAVARRCGFASPAHFSRRFKDEYGVTPREWRRRGRGGSPAYADAPPHPEEK